MTASKIAFAQLLPMMLLLLLVVGVINHIPLAQAANACGTGGVCVCTGVAVDCSSKSLTAIPSAIPASTQHLNLFNNHIASVSASAFAGLTSLTYLSLESNAITSIPDTAFADLTALNWLLMTSNFLTSLSASTFAGLTAVTVLSLFQNELTSIPSNLFTDLTALRQLNLGYNDLTSLPLSAFTGLTALNILSLHRNQITTVPANMFPGLSALKELYLHQNQITSVSANAFTGLNTLTSLYLGNNPFTTLPPGLFKGLSNSLFLSDSSQSLSPNSFTVAPPGTYGTATNPTKCDTACATCYGAGSGACCFTNCLFCTSSAVCSQCYDGYVMMDSYCLASAATNATIASVASVASIASTSVASVASIASTSVASAASAATMASIASAVSAASSQSALAASAASTRSASVASRVSATSVLWATYASRASASSVSQASASVASGVSASSASFASIVTASSASQASASVASAVSATSALSASFASIATASFASIASQASASVASDVSATSARSASAASTASASVASVASTASASAASVASSIANRGGGGSDDSSSSSVIIIAAVVAALAVIVILALVFIVLRRRRTQGSIRRPKDSTGPIHEEAIEMTISPLNHSTRSQREEEISAYAVVGQKQPEPLYQAISTTATEVVYDYASAYVAGSNSRRVRDGLTIVKHLASGNFGDVALGQLPFSVLPPRAQNLLGPTTSETVQVAVKSLKSNADEKSSKDFESEAKLMAPFVHPNVVRLLAALVESEPHLVLLEFVQYGDLRTLLQKSKLHSLWWTHNEQIHAIRQIALGMEYLGTLHFVHRDLAARNCLVGQGMVVKIADFGLSRELASENDYYRMQTRGKLPVKWMAPETMTFRKFSTMSDVWSFGVTAWECSTYGAPPYGKMDGRDTLAHVEAGGRLPKPEQCSADLYNLMMSCWDMSPEKRPTFAQLVKALAALQDGTTTREIGAML
ncbi:proto-oncogene tyrosine-protein kinase FYN [Capsaspora owczarzaki ATCC 30864]|uniref:TKL protein kinase n=1 Tax=Capsaspora owczarzaki (strain ATCC 30864) TaxID=595528 RepID=A0A0D2WUB0_CAPO3|nr:proto-oncogene tyrosine-protein kinase FYN [Capsaspora owczarzaki ATCC 30864]KJE96215.1 TKL protein kinase [Capsaspora owczarzaki ATCC 30864]|eukprot:XP_004345319.2 proto-oncogene tyrosine-protein kinase FYN [Capsaspora owczarzaki ATCC 30864]